MLQSSEGVLEADKSRSRIMESLLLLGAVRTKARPVFGCVGKDSVCAGSFALRRSMDLRGGGPSQGTGTHLAVNSEVRSTVYIL